MHLKYKQTYDKLFIFAIISLPERLNLFAVFISHLLSLLQIVYACFALPNGVWMFLFFFFFFFLLYHFLYNLFHLQLRKERNCTTACGRPGEWDVFLILCQFFLLKIEKYVGFFSPYFSPPLHKCVSHHFCGTISPKLHLAVTSSTNLDSLFQSLYSWWGRVGSGRGERFAFF